MTLQEAQELVNVLRREQGLPEARFPDEDELSQKLHVSLNCPYCGSEDVSAGDYDGDYELTCTCACDECGRRWGERYIFIGAWPVE